MNHRIINSPRYPAFDRSEMIYSDPNGNLDTWVDSEQAVKDFLKSGLAGALEMIQFVFGYEGVTRAFTHQAVRTRHASWMQQSMRFTNVLGGTNRLPVKIPQTILNNPEAKTEFSKAYHQIGETCAKLVELGIPTEDVRSLYPTNTLTSIICCINYSSLRHQLSHRFCTQAQQGEWAEAAKQIKEIVTQYDPLLGEGLKAVCELIGKCDFDTSLDHPCPRRDKLPVLVPKEKYDQLVQGVGSW